MAKISKQKHTTNGLYLPVETKTYQDQERYLKIDRVRNLKALIKRSRAMKLRLDPRIKKLDQVCGVQVWLINGSIIREHIDVDFTSGGHGYRYLYVPINEIWIDDALNKEDIWPTMWHEFTERHLMERGWSYNDGHDYAARVEIGIRRGKEFVLPVANFNQIYPYSCGATAMKMVLEYFGHDLPEKRLMRMIKATSEKGSDMKDMVAAAKALGFKTKWKQGWTPEQVKKVLETGLPMVVNFQEKPQLGEGHYVVIVGYTKDEFIFSDPNNGDTFWKQKVKDFMKRWYELEDKTKQEGIVIIL